jgi:cation:H+ antiporter
MPLLAVLPHAWFADLPTLVLLLLAAVAVAVLGVGADWLVDSAAKLVGRLGLPKVVIGATIVSLGTTSPEMAVSVLAAWGGNPGLALGNGVGSIIADTGLIFGVGCLLAASIPADKFILKRQGWLQIGAVLLLAALAYGSFLIQGDEAALGRWVGVLLLGCLAGYLWLSVRWARQHPTPHSVGELEPVGADAADAVSQGPAEPNDPAWLLLIWGVVGLAMVILGGDTMVQSASTVAERWGVPEVVIASTLVALGTSLPELVVGLTAVRKGHPEILVGNVIGADILNVLFVIGAAAVAADLSLVDADADLPYVFLTVQLPAMLIIVGMFRLFMWPAMKKGSFSRWMGVPLLAGYVAFVTVSAWVA